MKDMWERSIFRLTSVTQLERILEGNGWVADDSFRRFIKCKLNAFFSSQIAEDGFAVARRVETKATSGACDSRRIYEALVDARVLAEKHRHLEVRGTSEHRPFGRDMALPRDAFKPHTDPSAPRLDLIVSTVRKLEWPTWGPARAHVPHCDLAVLQAYKESEGEADWDSINSRWMTFVLDAPIMLKHVGSEVWKFAIGDFGSASVIIPAEPFTCNGVVGYKPRFGQELEFVVIDKVR